MGKKNAKKHNWNERRKGRWEKDKEGMNGNRKKEKEEGNRDINLTASRILAVLE